MGHGRDEEEFGNGSEPIPQDYGSLSGELDKITGDFKRDTEEWKKEEEENKRQFRREQGSKDIVSASLQGVVRVLSNVAILAIAAVAWHFLLPRWLSWLDEKQIQGLLTFLLSGAVIGSVSNFFRQHA